MTGLIHIPPPLLAVPNRPIWLDAMHAWANRGVLEKPGPDQDHPLIVEMLELAGVKDKRLLHDETPWCASCGAAAVLASGLRTPPRPYHARSWEGWGRRIDRNGPNGDERMVGCFAVLWRGSMQSGQGHLACWIDDMPGGLIALFGGNQNNRLGLATYPEHRVLSYRWPDETCLVGAEAATS